MLAVHAMSTATQYASCERKPQKRTNVEHVLAGQAEGLRCEHPVQLSEGDR